MRHAKHNRTRNASWGLAALALVMIFLGAGGGTAAAHGGLTAEADTCVLRFPGTNYKMHFSGYQPNSQQKEFCEDIPERGTTTVAIDYFSPELRRMEVELRVIRDPKDPSAESKNMDSITELYLPPQKRPTGTFSFQHDFVEGDYIGLLKLNDGVKEHISRFPFAVGVAPRSTTFYFTLMLSILLAGGGTLIWAVRTNRLNMR